MRLGEGRVQLQRAAIRARRQVVLLLARQRDAEIVVALGVVGPLLQGAGVGVEGFVEPALVAQGVAEIIQRFGVPRLLPQRLAEGLLGVGELAVGGEGVAQVVVRLGKARPKPHEPRQPLDRPPRVAPLVVDEAGEKERGDVVGLVGQQAIADRLRRRQIAGIIGLPGLGQVVVGFRQGR